MSPNVEEFLLECPDARLVLQHPDGEHFRLFSLAEVGHVTAEAAKAGYTIAGAVAMVCGEPHGAAEYGCVPLIRRVIDALKAGLQKPEPSGDLLTWCEALGRLEDPRS